MLNEFLHFASRFASKEIHTSRFSFKLVTRITVNLLFFCTIAMYSSIILLGDVIECHTDNRPLSRIISQRCYAEGVFIDRSLLNASIGVGGRVISPGVGPHHKDANYYHQSYYQWIPPMLITQALIFFLPRAIWKLFEDGTMEKLMEGGNAPILTERWKEKRNHLILYMKNVDRKYHRCYVIKYFFCELLSIVATILNMFLMKFIINDFWVEYQPAIAALLRGDLTKFRQLATVLFPLQAKCNYNSFGRSGSLINHDALCYLPLNVANEKIFVFLYFWFILILFYSVLSLIFFFTMLLFNTLRVIDVGRMCERTVTRRECKKISGNGDFGYWFTLLIFHKNLSPVYFQDLAKELYDKVDDLPSYQRQSVLNDDKEKY